MLRKRNRGNTTDAMHRVDINSYIINLLVN